MSFCNAKIFPPAVLLLLFSIFSLLGANIAEYGFGLLPCHLCLYQRVPHYIILPLMVMALLLQKYTNIYMWLTILGSILILVGAGIAMYHVGVEQGIIVMETSCADMIIPSTGSLEEMRQQLLATPGVPCDKPQFLFLNISMAGWNFICSSIVGVVTFIMSIKYHKKIGV